MSSLEAGPQSVPFEMRYGGRVRILAQYGTGVASKLQPSLMIPGKVLFHCNNFGIKWYTTSCLILYYMLP